jgi:hypothetical protein
MDQCALCTILVVEYADRNKCRELVACRAIVSLEMNLSIYRDSSAYNESDGEKTILQSELDKSGALNELGGRCDVALTLSSDGR